MSVELRLSLEKAGKVLLIALLIVLVIISFGWLYKKEKEKEEILENHLKELEERVCYLQNKKKELEERKRKIYLLVRFIIGILILISDCVVLLPITSFNLINILNELLVVNGAILMIYSFIAFVSYGTIDNFVSAMKQNFLSTLERQHVDSLEELSVKEKELIEIKKELKEKKKQIENREGEMAEFLVIIEKS